MSRLHLRPENHFVNRVGWLRAAVLGANDGIISTASLIVGVAAAAATQNEVLIASVAGTLLLMAPSVYHRLRWRQGGKRDVVLVAHRFFICGSALLAFSIDAAVFTVSDFLYGRGMAVGCAVGTKSRWAGSNKAALP